MLRISALFVFLFSLLAQNSSSQVLMPSGDDRNSFVLLNGNWNFRYYPSLDPGKDSIFYKPGYDNSGWGIIKVPGCWELQGFAKPEYGGSLKAGTGLYLTKFTVPSEWIGKNLYIAFDGVCYGYDFWVNGRFAGSFASSYNRQTFDISDLVKNGQSNTLAVKVSTRPKGWEFDTNDSWSLSGIIRDVKLFALPVTYIKDVIVKTFVPDTKKASISVSTIIGRNKTIDSQTPVRLTGRLTDRNGRIVKEFSSLESFKQGSTGLTVSENFPVDNPVLWTAETPYLYNMELALFEGDKLLHTQNIKVGIRQLTIENKIIKINGQPVKFRGINHHDLSPVNGTAITRKEILEDLLLMKRANINMIRTSHYPPDKRLIELCDSMGFYVVDEVPIGYDGNHLNDTSYLPILLKRAEATVWRDKNSPAVIVWSVGNENPLTAICIETGHFVKRLDNTRPYCYPQVGSYFRTIKYTFQDDSAEVLAPHYPGTADLNEYATNFNRPFIITEYAHDFGLDFDRVEESYEIMHKSPALAGGAVWHFHEQGIMRKSDVKVNNKIFTPYVWADSVTYFDCATDKGTDGIVYSDRVPQSDYWELRKVFAPVRVLNKSISLIPGKQSIVLKIENRFDFTDLASGRFEWEISGDTTVIGKGGSIIHCVPHDSADVKIDFELLPPLTALFYTLKVKFFDAANYQYYERSFNLNSDQTFRAIADKLEKTAGKTGKALLTGKTGEIKVINNDKKEVITGGPYLRVGRQFTLSNWVLKDDTSQDSINIGTEGAWFPHFLKNPVVAGLKKEKNTEVYNLTYRRGKTEQKFSGTVEYRTTGKGWIDVSYRFVPEKVTGFFIEAGLSFLAPAEFTEFRWVGQGPFPSYPGKSALSEFGIYHLNAGDLNYQGNRTGVKIALITDKKGNGFGVLAKDADIAVERTPDGVLFSHNALVSGRYSKKSLPVTRYDAGKVKEISGSFTLIPLNSEWPSVLKELFGKPGRTVIPFNPYYHSYDQ